MTEVAEPSEPRYAGLVTRWIAFVVDAALLNLAAAIVGVGVSLVVSLLRLPHDLKAILAVVGGAAYVLWTLAYFVTFWSTTGQTPGSRTMQIRVMSTGGESVKPRRALLRCIGLVLAALPLFAGYVVILFDARRRGLHDWLARTVVVDAPQVSLAAQRRQALVTRGTQSERARRGAGTNSSVSGDDHPAPALDAGSGRESRV